MKNFIFFIFFYGFLVSQAQTKSRAITLQECIDYGLAHNENLRSAELGVAYQKEFKKGATEVPKLAVQFMQGQFNSVYKYDNSLQLIQQIPFPGVFAAHSSLVNELIKCAKYKVAFTRLELIRQIKSTYYSLQFQNSLNSLLQQEDSIYQSFASLVKTKYQNGTGSLLEKISADSKVMEIKNKMLENYEDINSLQIQLQALINTSETLELNSEDLSNKPLTLSLDTSSVLHHPYLEEMKHEIDVHKKTKLLELNKILPELVVGYFNLSIYGPANIGKGDYFLERNKRLQGFIVGANIPLWFYPQTSRVKAEEISSQIAKSQYEYNVDVFEGELKHNLRLYLKYQNSIGYYKTNAIANSKLIQVQALKSFKANEISHIDYISVVGSAIDIERNFLNIINQNNQTVIGLEYLMLNEQK